MSHFTLCSKTSCELPAVAYEFPLGDPIPGTVETETPGVRCGPVLITVKVTDDAWPTGVVAVPMMAVLPWPGLSTGVPPVDNVGCAPTEGLTGVISIITTMGPGFTYEGEIGVTDVIWWPGHSPMLTETGTCGPLNYPSGVISGSLVGD